ncbi:hypothetical protein AAFF_G00331560 [Aldrovandia affinis]|uniref:Uncharacterized protein n=1 Tax=Aldrovandia affinis TaxID=143900 RepID=A0AAD7SLC0_9TELE|nr:hypothetical protein AAFF_G00331560 [Aldrovandia affinis]
MAARDDGQRGDLPCPDPYHPDAAGASAPGPPDQPGLLLRSRLRPDDGPVATATPAAARHPVARHRPDGEQRRALPPAAPGPGPAPAEMDHGDRRPRFLQSLRLHKKVSVPTLSQEGALRPAAGERPAIPMPGSAALPKKKQLPPPTRGLPCFSSGPQPSGLARAPTLFGLYRPLGLREPENGLPKAGGLIPPNYSRLPKPKIH